MFKKIFLGLVLFVSFYFNADAAVLDSSSCIITVSENSYDVTTLKNTHSGGDVFNCGTDMTNIFNNEHGYNLKMISRYKISNTNTSPTASAVIDKESENDNKITPINNLKGKGQARKTEYHFGLIVVISIVLYLISFIFAKKKIISELNHRKIWNILLLVTFLGMGLLGIVLTIRLEYGIDLLKFLGLNTKFWHVEFGVAMTLIAIFHTFWHIPYFKSYLPKKKSITNVNPETK